LTQSDNQVRAAIAAALGDFKGDEGAFSTETKLLQSDPSYAIHAATAIGASGSSDPFDVLSEHADPASDWHVTVAIVNAVAASRRVPAGMVTPVSVRARMRTGQLVPPTVLWRA